MVEKSEARVTLTAMDGRNAANCRSKLRLTAFWT